MTDMSAGTAPSGAWAGRALVGVAGLHAVNWAVGAIGSAFTIPDLVFTIAFLAATIAIARGLSRNASWAWWAALLVSMTALFFVAPVVGTMIMGGGFAPVGTGWDVVYFPLVTLLLIVALFSLHASRLTPGRHDGD